LNGDCENLGSIDMGAIGGSGIFTFNWSHLTGANNPEDVFGLNDGIYSITISDTWGCQYIINDLVVENDCVGQPCLAEPAVLAAINNEVCIEEGLTSVSTQVVTPPVVPIDFIAVYFLVDQEGLILQIEDQPSFDVNASGIYSITSFVYNPATFVFSTIIPGTTSLDSIPPQILQGGGSICAVLDEVGIALDVINFAGIEVDIVAENCGTSNATVIFSPVSFSYEWENGLVGPTQTEMKSGDYQLTVTDNNGCSEIVNIAIDSVCFCVPPVVSSSITEPVCGETNGVAEVIVEGDPGAFSYTWSTNANSGIPNALGNQRSGLNAGIYEVTISYPLLPDCEVVEIITIGIDNGPEVTAINTTPANCFANDGTVELLPAEFTYIWVTDPQYNGNYRDDLAEGTYQVIVMDNVNFPGCPNIIDVVIDQANPYAASIELINAPGCMNDNGTIEVVVDGLNGGAVYTWDDGTVSTEPIRENLGSGYYAVTVNDNGSPACEVSTSITIQTENPVASINITPVVYTSCFGEFDATINPVIDYEASFVLPATVYIENQNGEQFPIDAQLGVGDYCIKVEDANGCESGSKCFVVDEPDAIVVETAVTDATCDPTGIITIVVTGGSGSYTYEWSDLQNSTDDPEDRYNLMVGTYDLTVTDANGCTGVALGMTIDEDCDTGCDEPVITSIYQENSTCNESNGTIQIILFQGPLNYDFNWSPAVSTNNIANNIPAGIYNVTISQIGIPDCKVETSIVLNSDGIAEPTIVNIQPAGCTTNNGTIEFSPDTLSYSWSDDSH